MRTVKFFTLGCKVNQYETEELRERFCESGFREAKALERADNYVINTCTVTANADRKSRYFINLALRSNPKARVIVTGCLAELDAKQISRIKGVTDVVKNRDKDKIIKLLQPKNRRANNTGKGISKFSGHSRAFIKVQDGCNNRCSYCKVPLVRGPSRSRSLEEIKKEAERLVGNGFKELVLCGICLGSYGKELQPRKSLAALIEELEGITGLKRIRLSSIEAGDISPALIKKMADSEKLCRHLHIPLQSGDDEVLKMMNRAYRSRDYLGIIRSVRKAVPQVAITTDIIVGFPGEKEENFKNTLFLVKEAMPLKVHTFPYSKRKGTEAAEFKGEVSDREIKERISRLRELSKTCALTFQRAFLGKKMEALIEARHKDDKSCWIGHTDNYLEVLVRSKKDLKNRLVRLKLKKPSGEHILADFS